MKILDSGYKNGRLHYRCECHCGTVKMFLASNVDKGKSKSCGCDQFRGFEEKNSSRHGMSRTPIHNLWSGMVQRCTDPNHPHYADYGGRGITVCEEWKTFENFYADMGERPEGMWLEREDNDKGYSKSNCKWATPLEQGQNKRNNVKLTYNGKTQILAAWSRETGLKYRTIHARLNAGKTAEEVLSA